jgi:hypothetical protein
MMPCIRHIPQPLPFDELKECVRKICRIRTDLNRFSVDEAIALILHGAAEASVRLGPLDDMQKDQIRNLVRASLGMQLKGEGKKAASLDVPEASLNNSHRIRFGLLSWCCLIAISLLTTVVAIDTFGHLPRRAWGCLYNFCWAPPVLKRFDSIDESALPPVFHVLESSAGKAKSLKIPPLYEGRVVAYYYSSNFYGLERPTSLSIPVASADEFRRISHTGGEYVSAFIVVSNESREVAIPLEQIVWADQHLQILLPAYPGRATIWVILPEDVLKASKSTEDHSIPTDWVNQ